MFWWTWKVILPSLNCKVIGAIKTRSPQGDLTNVLLPQQCYRIYVTEHESNSSLRAAVSIEVADSARIISVVLQSTNLGDP
jgi:hypothetical protein